MDQQAFRRMAVPEMVSWLRQNGEPAETRTDIDTSALRGRFPRLRNVVPTDVDMAGPNGALPGRVYVDATAAPTGRALVWAHGGAFVGGTLDMPEANWVSMELASRGVPVLSIDYTKCLGVSYPVPSDDVLAWWAFARRHAERLLDLPAEALFLGGASAGATLTAGAVQRIIDSGGAVPRGLVLVYPPVHPDSVDPSHLPEEGEDGGLSLNFAGTWAAMRDPQVFPGLGTAEGFPATLSVACELDGFVPSAVAFHELLDAAGVDNELRIEQDADHGHIDEPSDPTAIRTITAMAEWIARH